MSRARCGVDVLGGVGRGRGGEAGAQGLLGGNMEKEKELWVGVLSGSSSGLWNAIAGTGCWKGVVLGVSSGTSGLNEVGSSSPAKIPRPKVFQGLVIISGEGRELLGMLARSSQNAKEWFSIVFSRDDLQVEVVFSAQSSLRARRTQQDDFLEG